MSKFTQILFAGALAVSGSVAHAATMQTTYSASSYDTVPGSHSLWVSGGLGTSVGGDFNFSPSGVFKSFSNSGNVTGAELSGNVVSSIDGSSGFALSFDYDVDFSDFVPGPSYKSENGAPTVPGDNYFLNLVGGTLVGFGNLTGMNLAVSRRPEPTVSSATYATQVGTGSNAKNLNYGMANWFYLTVDSCTICGANGFRSASSIEGRGGDININLTELPGGPTPVPLPAGGLLLLTGLAGLAASRRGKKNKS